MTTPPPDARPRSVDIAFWLLIAGSVLLMFAGLWLLTMCFSAVRQTVDDDTVRQTLGFNIATGAICVIAGLGMGWLIGRLRRGRDPRYRRAVLALALAIGVVVVMLAVIVGYAPALIAVLPIIVGAMLLARPAATDWFSGARPGVADD